MGRQVLLPDDHDYFNGVLLNSVIDTVNATYASPVALLDVIDGLKAKRGIRDIVKAIEELIVIRFRPSLTEGVNTVDVNANQVFTCGVAESIISL